MGLFGDLTQGKLGEIYNQANFSTFYLAYTTLFISSTGENWPGLMYDLQYQGWLNYFFWISWEILSYFIFNNVFVAVIYEEYHRVH